MTPKIPLIIYVLLCPIFFMIGRELRSAQELFYQLGGLSLIIASILFYQIPPIRKSKINIWVGIFGIYSILLIVLNNVRYGVDTLYNIVVGIFLFYITQSIKKEDSHLILKTILWVCVINLLYMAAQVARFDFIFVIKGADLTILYKAIDMIGMLGLKSAMGIYMGLGMVACLAISPWLSLVFLVPLYLSQSSGAVLGTMTAISFYFWWMKRRISYIVMALGAIGLVGYFVFVDNPAGMSQTRPPMWKVALQDTVYGFNLSNPKLQSPYLRNVLTGFGIDAFQRSNIKYFKECDNNLTIRTVNTEKGIIDAETGLPLKRDDRGNIYRIMKDGKLKRLDLWDDPHCLPVTIFYNWGLVGIIISGFILYYIFKRFYGNFKNEQNTALIAMVIVLLASSLTQFPLALARLGYLFPILMGLFMVNTDEDG